MVQALLARDDIEVKYANSKWFNSIKLCVIESYILDSFVDGLILSLPKVNTDNGERLCSPLMAAVANGNSDAAMEIIRHNKTDLNMKCRGVYTYDVQNGVIPYKIKLCPINDY